MRAQHGYQLNWKITNQWRQLRYPVNLRKRVIGEEASQQGFDINSVEVREDEDYSCKPIHLVITNAIDVKTKSELLATHEQIKFTQLDLKLVNLSGKGKIWLFSLKTVLYIILLSFQLFALQGETVHDLASFRTLSFRIFVCYEILCGLSRFGFHSRRGAPFQ